MSDFDSIFQQILESENTTEQGTKFEELSRNFLLTAPIYKGIFKNIWKWSDFPYRKDISSHDIGIDLVAETSTNEFVAIQCKCHKLDSKISKDQIDSFLSASSTKFFVDNEEKTFSERILISTAELGSNATATIKNQTVPVKVIDYYSLKNADVDWQKLFDGLYGDQARLQPRIARDHQIEAIQKAHEYFKTHDRGKLIMACGTGKTLTSLRIVENESAKFVLFLVPSIALLSQTLSEWARDSLENLNAICVCSDETVSKGNDESDMQTRELALPATTDADKISKLVTEYTQNDNITVIFSTYQSLDKVHEAQKKFNIDFDFVICDEAHRTAGTAKDSEFTAIHDSNFIRARKRLYMTATPKFFMQTRKNNQDEDLWSMDNKDIFGDDIYRLNFGDAVQKDLLSDYKVLVCVIHEQAVPIEIQKDIADDQGSIPADLYSKIIGTIHGLSKNFLDESNENIDPEPMKTAVSFCGKISDSKRIEKIFNTLKFAKMNEKLVPVESRHVDGSMDSAERNQKISWLKKSDDDSNTCKILTNVRCLSEGVDVPALDAVAFLSPKRSKVDIVQAIGRAMRKAPNKKYGYVIIPIFIAPGKTPEEVLEKNQDTQVIWEVAKALRSHDSDRLLDELFTIEMNQRKKSDRIRIVNCDSHKDPQEQLSLDLKLEFEQLSNAIYAKLVQNVGNRHYLEDWAADISEIAENHKNFMLAEIDKPNSIYSAAFDKFLTGLRETVNPTIDKNSAIDMLAQHFIARPVFQALFTNSDGTSIIEKNPISQAMQNMLDLLESDNRDAEQSHMKKFYDSIKISCGNLDNAEARQNMIVNLYDKFFKYAMKNITEKLGIVYTPIQVVDFILHSVDDILHRDFNMSLSSPNVHILDPFTGTGTFITRILQTGLIQKSDLIRKFNSELHANEIVLLAYYIASVNIENAFKDLSDGEYQSFPGICLTDTFNLFEQTQIEKQTSIENLADLQENSQRVNDQKSKPIQIIVGNPPYSVGQKSANDNNQNETYAKLEKRIADTYAKNSSANLKKAVYDSYIKAFKWASERIGNNGIIGFVTNGGWLDGVAFDGMRKCFEEEFSSIYVFNLRGNANLSGELRRKEKDNVFGSGSRASVAITILVKNPNSENKKADIFYRDIGDYLTREQKLDRIKQIGSCLSTKFNPTRIIPNEKHDWINQRGNSFDDMIIIGNKKDKTLQEKFFCDNFSCGISTNRDVWCYNFSRESLSKNIQTTIDFCNQSDPNNLVYDRTKISITKGILDCINHDIKIKFDDKKIVESIYRPFVKSYLYYDPCLNERRFQIPKLFPTGSEKNLLICVPNIGNKKDFSVLITDKIPDLHFSGDSQCFPLYYYEPNSRIDIFNPESMNRIDGITDFILDRAVKLYGKNVTKEDIFFYVYGFLHLPSYRKTFANELKKSLPRLMLVSNAETFWNLSRAGRELADIHLHYETLEPPKNVEVVCDGDDYRIRDKLRLSADKTVLIYNEQISIKNIPARSFEYVVNGRSPVEWIIDRYQVKVDSDSGILNDPNDWCTEHENTRYILDLILSCITLSLRTLDIVENLPSVEFES